MTNLFESLEHFFERTETHRIRYNFTYLPPLPFPDELPKGSLPFGWMIAVAVKNLRITLNLLAILSDDDMNDLSHELDEVIDAWEAGQEVKALFELADFSIKLANRDASLAEFSRELRDLIARIVGGNHSLALDFWLIFEDTENLLMSKMDDRHLDSLEEYRSLFRHVPLPEIAHTFTRDDVFADMRVTAPNPRTLRRCTAIPANLPYTNALFQQTFGDDELDTALAEGRIYILDFKRLDGALLGSFPGPQKYLAAPMALFAVPKTGDRRLTVLAIQCGQQPGPNTPLFTPPGADADESTRVKWLMAKTHVQVADGNMHEAVSHLGETHLLVQPFALATFNCLTEKHPVGRLLHPHFEGTLNINFSAQGGLIASKGIIDQIMGGTIDTSRMVAGLGAVGVTTAFDQSYPRQNFQARGVMDREALPYYPYRDCTLMLWDTIRIWVEDYLKVAYADENGPERDDELQTWYREVVHHDAGRIGGFGEDGALRTRTYLTDALTMIIWTASAGHAAVNRPQQEIMSYTPAMPLAAYAPPPGTDDRPTMSDWLRMLPPYKQTVLQMNTGILLGGVVYTRLGCYPEGWFEDARIQAAANDFRDRLAVIEAEMVRRFPEYIFQRPSILPQSINI